MKNWEKVDAYLEADKVKLQFRQEFEVDVPAPPEGELTVEDLDRLGRAIEDQVPGAYFENSGTNPLIQFSRDDDEFAARVGKALPSAERLMFPEGEVIEPGHIITREELMRDYG
jgi:hypothetical protein